MQIETKDCVITHNEPMEVVIISWVPEEGPSGNCIVTYSISGIDSRGDGLITPQETERNYYDWNVDEINLDGCLVSHEIEQHFIRIAKNHVE